MKKHIFRMQRVWNEIESGGEREVKRWLDGVEGEGEWADLMDRVMEWGDDHGIE